MMVYLANINDSFEIWSLKANLAFDFSFKGFHF